MRLSKHKRRTLPLMNMTPMIDVVFLLLVFFMTVSQVSKLNRAHLELPKLKGAEDQRPTVLTINITREGRIIVSGNAMSAARLGQMIVEELEKLAAVGDDPSKLTVVLRVDHRADCRTVNQIVTALAKLQVNRVRVAVEVPQG